MKLAFLLGLLSVTAMMGKMAKCDEMAERAKKDQVTSCLATLENEVEKYKALVKGDFVDQLSALSCVLTKKNQQIPYEGGKEGASSEFQSRYGSCAISKAFKPEPLNSDCSWSSVRKGLPATVWYHFKSKVHVSSFSFTSRLTRAWWKQAPKTFQFVASNDCSSWEVLKTVSNSGFTGPSQTKSWEVPCTTRKAYSCYGIKTTSTFNQQGIASLANLTIIH